MQGKAEVQGSARAMAQRNDGYGNFPIDSAGSEDEHPTLFPGSGVYSLELMAKSSQYIIDVGALIDEVESLSPKALLLFRGQDCNDPLLPKIARPRPTRDTTELERTMLKELKRRTARHSDLLGKDDWDALVVAQHFGMSTRLLDWTTNPFIALWFAALDQRVATDGYVYMLPITDDLILDRDSETDPFATGRTRVFKPSINNDRLAAQAGWFTAHRYSQSSRRFVDLHKNKELKRKVLMKGVKGSDKSKFLCALDRVGINQESMFPGLEGTCRYVDWRFRKYES